MDRRIRFSDGSILEISAQTIGSGQLAEIAYRLLLEFVDFELVDEEQWGESGITALDDDDFDDIDFDDINDDWDDDFEDEW